MQEQKDKEIVLSNLTRKLEEALHTQTNLDRRQMELEQRRIPALETSVADLNQVPKLSSADSLLWGIP